MKILYLTLYKKWFDLIASGKKKEEYREDKPYWQKRLLQEDGWPKRFDEIHFKNGYGNNRPFMRVKCNGVSRGCGRITIHLGKVLENCDYQKKREIR
jgi:hypothetical protein